MEKEQKRKGITCHAVVTLVGNTQEEQFFSAIVLTSVGSTEKQRKRAVTVSSSTEIYCSQRLSTVSQTIESCCDPNETHSTAFVTSAVYIIELASRILSLSHLPCFIVFFLPLLLPYVQA